MKLLTTFSRLIRKPHSFSQLLYSKNISTIKVKCVIQEFKRNISYGRCLNAGFHKDPADEYLIETDEYVDLLQEQYTFAKNALFSNSGDEIVNQLKNCPSLLDVFKTLQHNLNDLRPEHLAQTALVIWDLQKMYLDINVANNSLDLDQNNMQALCTKFVAELEENEIFNEYLSLIEQLKFFSPEFLSYTLYYLHKLDLKKQSEIYGALFLELKKKLVPEVTLSSLSKLMVYSFNEFSIGGFFAIQDYIPFVFENIETVDNVEDFKSLTICLNCLQEIVGLSELNRYKVKLNSLIDSGKITGEDYNTILKSIVFLCIQDWRDLNLCSVNKCIRVLQGNLHQFNLNELLLLYEIFNQNQEPLFILDELQRNATKYYFQMEESKNSLVQTRLRLLQAMLSFRVIKNRSEINKLIEGYLKKGKLSGPSLLEVQKLLIKIKTSDPVIHKMCLNQLLTVLIENHQFRKANLMKISAKYLHTVGLTTHKNKYFERKLCHYLRDELQNGYEKLSPNGFSQICAFLLKFETDKNTIEHVINLLEANKNQLTELDFYRIGKSLDPENSAILDSEKLNSTTNYLFHKALNKFLCVKNMQQLKESSYSIDNIKFFNTLNLTIKTGIFMNSMKTATRLCEVYKNFEVSNSKLLMDVCYCLYSSNALLPDVVDRLTQYIITFKDNILGYNAEKLIYLCYHLGYMPKSISNEHGNSSAFFEAIADIILRDQERMTGLSYLQACLALCFFQKLPESLIKQVFNIGFLEKLDLELASCYFKDIYPIRVRHRMMQLNRAVCLDYPECNVPWFHQKYIEETKKIYVKEHEDHHFTANVRLYLEKLFGSNNVTSNHITPYGYLIDFVLNLDDANLKINNLAILLMRPGAYTHINEQLKGPHQLKMRHLEILGYRIITINHLDWMYLATGEEKVKYLRDCIIKSDEIKNPVKSNIR